MVVEFTVIIDGKIINFKPGDVLDLGKEGLIEWHKEPIASAKRVIMEERQKRTREIMDFVKEKTLKEMSN